jgi:hypothetical protein
VGLGRPASPVRDQEISMTDQDIVDTANKLAREREISMRDPGALPVAAGSVDPACWSWRCGRAGIGLFQSSRRQWTREGQPVRFGVYSPIPGSPPPPGVRSAAIVVGAWLLAGFLERAS